MKQLLIVIIALLLACATASATLQASYSDYYRTNIPILGVYKQGVTVELKNTGTTTEQGLVELQLQKASGFQSVVSAQTACDYRTPWNVHRTYTLAPGQSATFDLTASNVPAGTYYPILVHVDQCCTDGVNGFPCAAKSPWGWEYKLTPSPITFADPNANANDQCNTDYEALQYIHAHGNELCVSAVCKDASSLTSTAQCAASGECASGAIQSTVCPDGSSIDIRTCDSGAWHTTGATCTGAPIPPAPKARSINWQLWGLIIAGAALVLMIIRKTPLAKVFKW